jgi:PIN domain nuclease of toxin-antitoxin system
VTFLIDTHTLLWAATEPEKLPDRVRGILIDESSELLVSIVVPWEMAIKNGVGKLREADPILRDFERLMIAAGYRILETSVRHVVQSGRLPLHHRDPFDRLLAAQALDLRLPILSCDKVFDRYAVRRIWK